MFKLIQVARPLRHQYKADFLLTETWKLDRKPSELFEMPLRGRNHSGAAGVEHLEEPDPYQRSQVCIQLFTQRIRGEIIL